MEIWRVTVFATGQAFDNDFAALKPAKQWGLEKLNELGLEASAVEWNDAGTSSTASLKDGSEVHIALRTSS